MHLTGTHLFAALFDSKGWLFWVEAVPLSGRDAWSVFQRAWERRDGGRGASGLWSWALLCDDSRFCRYPQESGKEFPEEFPGPVHDSLQGMAGGIPGGDAVGEYALETTRSKEKSAKKPDYFLCLRLKGVRLIPIGSLVVLMPPLPNKVLHRIVQKNPVGKKTYYLFCSR